MDPNPVVAIDDTVMDHVVKWLYRFGLTWCASAVLVYAWRGSLPWVGFYLSWLAFTVWSDRSLRRSRDRYLLAKANLEYQRERREGEQ